MKKRILILIAAALALPVSCTMDEPAGGQVATSQKGDIEITVADFVDADGAFGDTRSTISPVEGKPGQFAFSWAAGDEVGVFPNAGEGSQQLMVTVGTEGKIGDKTLSGTTVGWKVEPDMSYAAYYPMTEDYDLKSDAVIFDYGGQVQNGNNSLDHLGAKDFLVAAPCTAIQKSGSEYGQLDFKFSHVGAVVRIRHTIAEGEAGRYSAMKLQVAGGSSLIPIRLKANLFGEINNDSDAMSDKFVVNLNGCEVQKDQNLDVWMMLPPMNLKDKTLNVIFTGDGCSDISYLITGRNIESGKSYAINNGAPIEEHDLDFVDLGLPTGTLWATMDIGASEPGAKGTPFAWGETATKSSFSKTNYTLLEKYDKTQRIFLHSSDDAATVLWGDVWRFPTTAEFKELIDNCTWEKIYSGSTPLYMIGTSNLNGNKIKFYVNGSPYKWWAKERTGQSTIMVECLYTQAGNATSAGTVKTSTSNNIYDGNLVRPVKREKSYVDLGLPSGTLWATANMGAQATVGEKSSGYRCSWGECFYKTNISDYTTWQTYTYNEGEYNYDYDDGVVMSKYNSTDGLLQLQIDDENDDNNDDFAHRLYGSTWRIPTKEQWQELVENCAITKMSVSGSTSDSAEDTYLRFTALNGSYIDLPLTICCWYNSSSSDIIWYYWSSTRNSNNELQAYVYMNQKGNKTTKGSITPIRRYYSCPIRPVNNKNVDWSKLEKYKN